MCKSLDVNCKGISFLNTDDMMLFIAGSAASSFSIDSSTAAITTGALFDFESGPTSYGGTLATLAVEAVDGNGGTAQVPITVSITDINDAPVFSPTSYTGNVDEEQSSGAAVTLTVSIGITDEDSDTPTYSLIGENNFKAV